MNRFHLKRISILIVFILLLQISIYSQQKPVLTIFDFQSKQVPLNTVKTLETHFNNFFNNQGFYKIVPKNEINKALKEFRLRSNQLDENYSIKIGKILNSHIAILCQLTKNKQKITIHIKAIHLDDDTVIIDKKINWNNKIESIEELNLYLDEISQVLRQQKFIFKEEKNELVKRTVTIIPFYNTNNVTEYDYLVGLMRDALRTELLNTDHYLFTDFAIIDKEMKNTNHNEIIDEKKAKEMAWKLKADVVVIGKYVIIEDEIMINITAMDIFKNQVVASSNIKGELGLDVFRIVDQSAKDITKKMKQNIKMVNKSYFDEMIRMRNEEIAKLKQASTNDDHPIYWKRHFIDLTLIGGYTRLYSYASELDELTPIEGHGGFFGASFGYMYGFNQFFAFGPGITFFLVVLNQRSAVETRTGLSGATYILFQFMWGDLKYKKIAFLFDVGGLMLFSTKIGLYIKGFIFKVGFTLFNYDAFDFQYLTFGHCITIDFGYKINFRRRIKK